MPDHDRAAVRAALDRLLPLLAPHPWFKRCGSGFPPDRPGAPLGAVITYVAGTPGAEAEIHRCAAEVAADVPVYVVPEAGSDARPHGVGGSA